MYDLHEEHFFLSVSIQNIGGEAAEVSELFCDSTKRPSERRSCQSQPCPVPVWVVGQWSLVCQFIKINSLIPKFTF